MTEDNKELNVGLNHISKKGDEKDKKNMQKLARIGAILLLIFCILVVGNVIFQSFNDYINNEIHQWEEETDEEWHNLDDGTDINYSNLLG